MLDDTTKAALARCQRLYPNALSVMVKAHREQHGGGVLDAIRALAAVPTYAELEAKVARLREALLGTRAALRDVLADCQAVGVEPFSAQRAFDLLAATTTATEASDAQ